MSRLPHVLVLLSLALLFAACSQAEAQPAARQSAPPLAPENSFPAGLPSREALALDSSWYSAGHLWAHGGDSIVDGNAVTLGSDQPNAKALSWAIYLQQKGAVTSGVHKVIELLPGASGRDSRYWVALSNYAKGKWEWYGPFTVEEPSIFSNNELGYTTDYALSYMAVVVDAGSVCHINDIHQFAGGAGSDDGPGNQVIEVGPGREFNTITAALAKAQSTGPLDIVIYPNVGNVPYIQEALLVKQGGLRFFGIRTADNQRPRISGAGFDYSGAGSVPRAIFQFDPGVDQCIVHGLELLDAHNDSHNGAGVRVNQAKSIWIDDCLIHDCDMGVMSNGSAAASTGELSLGACRIYNNGNFDEPGYNHNIYAGGMSFSMQACEVYGALTGHNVKSRAHYNNITNCYIHDSANRELDIVDEAGNTDIAQSSTFLIGNVIVKADPIDGNKAVIHFGQDGGADHDGDIFLLYNTIVTPYISPVIDLSAPSAGAMVYDNIIWDAGSEQNGQVLVNARNGADLANTLGGHNWLSHGFSLPAAGAWDSSSMFFAAAGIDPPFRDAANGDFHLLTQFADGITDAALEGLQALKPDCEYTIPNYPDGAYVPEFAGYNRFRTGLMSDVGAYESHFGE